MDAALAALAEPHRREILRLIQTQELPAGQIAAHFDISRPAISQHLHVLLDAGLVTERREGTRHMYRLNSAGFEDLARFIGLFWDVNLERLKAEAERQEQALRAKEQQQQ